MHRSVGLFLAGTCFACVTAPAAAQSTDAAAPAAQPSAVQTQGDQNEIVITAQKRTERLLDVPQSVSVISGESLENQHAQRLSDYLTRIPSANIVESQAGDSRIVLRGINTGGVGATVATYIDEAPFGSATGLANGGVLAPDIDPFDLARVEVLRGPQGTLYGANSLGGLVKFVTVLPNTREFGAAAEAGVEDVARGDTGWWTRAAANVPLSGAAALRVSGFYRKDPGYIDDPHLGDDVNDGKTYGGRASLLLKPTDRLRIRATAMAENIRSNGTNTVDLDPVTLRPVLGALDHLRVLREPNDIDYRLYNTTVDYDFGRVGLVSSTSFGTLDQSTVEDVSSAYAPLLSLVFGAPLGAGLDQGLTQRRFTQEVRLASEGVQPVEWTVGGFYTHEKNRLSQNLFGVDAATGERAPAAAGVFVVALPSLYSEYAGFANVTWHVAPKFDLTAGGRYSHNHQSNQQITSGLLVGGSTVYTGKSSDNVFTYSLAPTFKPNAHTRIYARIAKGYRPGGPNAVSPLEDAAVPREFGPDTTTNYEVGIKTETNDRRLSLEATAFLIDWQKIQLLVQIAGLGVNANGRSARSQGVELAAGFNPNRYLSFYANGSYVDAHLTQDTPESFNGFKGDQLPYNPKWQGTVGAEYDHPLSASVTGHAGISWHYTGKRRSDFRGEPAPGPQLKLDAFSQIDAHAGVDVGRFRVDAFVHNLTNARGITNVGFFGDVNGNLAAAVIRPRSIGLSLGYRY
jgi:outer membrane receptor protein involved in Fe transport